MTTGGRFEGQAAIVTGGAGGVGRATARRLTAQGCAVVVADIATDAAREVADELKREGGKAIAVTTNVAEEEAVRALVASALDEFGRLDVLHNNAADLGLGGDDLDLTELEVAVWDRRMAVNVRSMMLGCKYAVPAMRATGRGVIINMASVSGLLGADTNASYGASKAAVVGLTRYVASMYGREGIRCVAVAPSLVRTSALMAIGERRLAQFAAERLLPWAIEPDEIAGVVAWLASDEARSITGQTIIVDGGLTAHRPRLSMDAWEETLRAHPDWLG
ncbi:MAG TPA: SDR family oxidoreductase [Acidimicrobiales bacterium]|nr:SDR family oxidoreductase [Acidimicrobiales bacterium]